MIPTIRRDQKLDQSIVRSQTAEDNVYDLIFIYFSMIGWLRERPHPSDDPEMDHLAKTSESMTSISARSAIFFDIGWIELPTRSERKILTG